MNPSGDRDGPCAGCALAFCHSASFQALIGSLTINIFAALCWARSKLVILGSVLHVNDALERRISTVDTGQRTVRFLRDQLLRCLGELEIHACIVI
jgi:hypothetical protein